jgi:ABC-type multidrug transport system ATPase subunit/pSer/pThr/pTyr-binding forkhead associated (FHA) protein
VSAISFITGPLAGQCFHITRPVTTIGRDPSNDIVIRGDLNVSRHHARLLAEHDTWRIENLSQKNTLVVNRQRVRQAIIEDRSIIGLGNGTLFLFLAHSDAPASAGRAAPQALQALPLPELAAASAQVSGSRGSISAPYTAPTVLTAPPEAFSAPHEESTDGDSEREEKTIIAPTTSSIPPQEALPPMRPIKLEANALTLGRHADNTVVLPHPQVSGHHARLLREGGTYRLYDLNSTNHVYINAQPVTNHLLKLGDEIRLGPYRLVYEGTHLAQYDESRCIRIDALNLSAFGAHHAPLLNNISLSIPAHAFVALVGGSGAGKSTLLDALCGLRPAAQGAVLYNGQHLYNNRASFDTQMGYVPQDDIVHRALTVERALYYAARLRLPGDFTDEQIQQRINEVLEEVELSERRERLIKTLSGGQRKRVSIALELLANPSLFFLDEPTSGLDPGLDRKMMLLLRKLANKGHTVILVTHATSHLNVCDYVCFLAPGGRLAYFGPPEEARRYFGQTDFAEIYGYLEPTDHHPKAAEQAEARFTGSRDYQQYIAQPLSAAANSPAWATPTRKRKRSKRGNPFKQWLLLSQRHLELLKNDLPTLLLLLLQTPLMAVLLLLLIRFELGASIFDGNHIVQCLPQIRTSTGVLALPDAPAQGGLVNCERVTLFLQTDPDGRAYAQARGGVNQALQDFLVDGEHGNAQRAVFMVVLIAVLFGCINGSREFIKEAAIYRRERAVSLRILPYLLSKGAVFGVLALIQSAALTLLVNVFEPLHQGVFWPVLLETSITLSLTSVAGVMLGLLISALAPQ